MLNLLSKHNFFLARYVLARKEQVVAGKDHGLLQFGAHPELLALEHELYFFQHVLVDLLLR